VPVTVSVYVPAGVFLFVEMVSVEVPEPAIVEGLNEPFECAGNPFTPKFTVDENGPFAVMATV
jgi:hypothetical protein